MYCNSLPIEYIRSKKQSTYTDKVQKRTHMHTQTHLSSSLMDFSISMRPSMVLKVFRSALSGRGQDVVLVTGRYSKGKIEDLCTSLQ